MSDVARTPRDFPGVGEPLGEYVVTRILRQGAASAIVVAERASPVRDAADKDAEVVVKILASRLLRVPAARARFKREAIAAASLTSKHVVHVIELGELPSGAPFIAMEFLRGMDLDELLETEGTPGLDPNAAIHFVLQILAGLQEAHASGIVHRDVKLSNCFVAEENGERILKILDFGISKFVGDSDNAITHVGAALGTPGFMAPEQALSPRDAEPKSDVYSAAVVLYVLLAGELPIQVAHGGIGAFVRSLLYEMPTPLDSRVQGLPPGLVAAVHAGLSRSLADRPASAREFARMLSPYADATSARVLAAIESFDPAAAPQVTGSGSMPVESRLSPRASFAGLSAPNALGFRTMAAAPMVPGRPHGGARDSVTLPAAPLPARAASPSPKSLPPVVALEPTVSASDSPPASATRDVVTPSPSAAAPAPASPVSTEAAPLAAPSTHAVAMAPSAALPAPPAATSVARTRGETAGASKALRLWAPLLAVVLVVIASAFSAGIWWARSQP